MFRSFHANSRLYLNKYVSNLIGRREKTKNLKLNRRSTSCHKTTSALTLMKHRVARYGPNRRQDNIFAPSAAQYVSTLPSNTRRLPISWHPKTFFRRTCSQVFPVNLSGRVRKRSCNLSKAGSEPCTREFSVPDWLWRLALWQICQGPGEKGSKI